MPSGNRVLVSVLVVLVLVVAYFAVMGFLYPLFGNGVRRESKPDLRKDL
jgi:hypothetical protein